LENRVPPERLLLPKVKGKNLLLCITGSVPAHHSAMGASLQPTLCLLSFCLYLSPVTQSLKQGRSS
jgi:hypothetical protein